MNHQPSIAALYVAMAGAAGPAFGETDPWALLSAVEIEEIVTETRYEVRKSFPEQLEQGISDFRISGYAMPMEAGASVRQVMLVSDMGSCPFCGQADHGITLMVELDEPISTFDEGTRLSLVGDLEAVTDPDTWQSAVMRHARVVAN
ncbi:hypothetical protein [Aliiroseovarius sp.]|uniref:hypothetical protein n=1 Tax=Aliiroseovarius sp. TaxID=1872442 RepID=UPI003BAC62FC